MPEQGATDLYRSITLPREMLLPFAWLYSLLTYSMMSDKVYSFFLTGSRMHCN